MPMSAYLVIALVGASVAHAHYDNECAAMTLSGCPGNHEHRCGDFELYDRADFCDGAKNNFDHPVYVKIGDSGEATQYVWYNVMGSSNGFASWYVDDSPPCSKMKISSRRGFKLNVLRPSDHPAVTHIVPDGAEWRYAAVNQRNQDVKWKTSRTIEATCTARAAAAAVADGDKAGHIDAGHRVSASNHHLHKSTAVMQNNCGSGEKMLFKDAAMMCQITGGRLCTVEEIQDPAIGAEEHGFECGTSGGRYWTQDTCSEPLWWEESNYDRERKGDWLESTMPQYIVAHADKDRETKCYVDGRLDYNHQIGPYTFMHWFRTWNPQSGEEANAICCKDTFS